MDKSYFKEYKKEYAKTHKRLDIYLPLEEYEEFKKIAVELGYGNKVGKVVKEFAISRKQKSYIYPPELKEKLEENTFLLRNVANNINQMAHLSNTVKQMVDEYRIFDHLKKMEDIIKTYAHNEISKK